MQLIESDVKKIIGAVDWAEEDVKTLKSLLVYAGKDKAGDYEHYRLTTIISNYESAIRGMKQIIEAFEERAGKKVEVGQKKPVSTTTSSTTTSTVKSDGLLIDSEKLKPLVKEVIEQYPEETKLAKEGLDGKLGFLTAKVCVAVGGDGDPKFVQKLIGEHLAEAA